jgi:acyl dehydratase
MNLHQGQKARRSLHVSTQHVEMYAKLTGDRNPIHFDEEFASSTPFGHLVAQGGITTGLLHALVAMDLPGPGTVFLNQNWQFTAPVYIGDKITAEVEILEVHQTKPVTHLSVLIKQQDGKTVLEGEAWCYTFSPKER